MFALTVLTSLDKAAGVGEHAERGRGKSEETSCADEEDSIASGATQVGGEKSRDN